MKIIQPDASIIDEQNPYKKIELIGRTCYKSEDKITETSCYPFVEGLISRQHFAMLEHARFTFRISAYELPVEALVNIPAVNVIFLDGDAKGRYYLNVSMSHLYNPRWENMYPSIKNLFDILRNMVELRWGKNQNIDKLTTYFYETGFEFVDDCNAPSIEYVSIKFICDRGVSHELVRHRCAVAQESTRYCNYSKEKFAKDGMLFIEPSTYDEWTPEQKSLFEESMTNAESLYNKYIETGLQPQQARAILPNALKTEVILTMNVRQWKHFFDLRYRGTTGKPHPDMQKVAAIAYRKLTHNSK